MIINQWLMICFFRSVFCDAVSDLTFSVFFPSLAFGSIFNFDPIYLPMVAHVTSMLRLLRNTVRVNNYGTCFNAAITSKTPGVDKEMRKKEKMPVQHTTHLNIIKDPINNSIEIFWRTKNRNQVCCSICIYTLYP